MRDYRIKKGSKWKIATKDILKIVWFYLLA